MPTVDPPTVPQDRLLLYPRLIKIGIATPAMIAVTAVLTPEIEQNSIPAAIVTKSGEARNRSVHNWKKRKRSSAIPLPSIIRPPRMKSGRQVSGKLLIDLYTVIGNCINEGVPMRKYNPRQPRSPRAKNIGIPENRTTIAITMIPVTGLTLTNRKTPLRIPTINRKG